MCVCGFGAAVITVIIQDGSESHEKKSDHLLHTETFNNKTNSNIIMFMYSGVISVHIQETAEQFLTFLTDPCN